MPATLDARVRTRPRPLRRSRLPSNSMEIEMQDVRLKNGSQRRGAIGAALVLAAALLVVGQAFAQSQPSQPAVAEPAPPSAAATGTPSPQSAGEAPSTEATASGSETATPASSSPGQAGVSVSISALP